MRPTLRALQETIRAGGSMALRWWEPGTELLPRGNRLHLIPVPVKNTTRITTEITGVVDYTDNVRDTNITTASTLG